MKKFWFSPKRFGYGATPSSWQGWVAVLVFLLCLVALRWMAPSFFRFGPAGAAVFIVIAVSLTCGFIVLVRSKTEGEWRWRWGKRD